METTSSKDNNTIRNYIAFFDLDGTIISENSGRKLTIAAYRRGLMSVSDLIKGIFLSLMYKFNLSDTTKIIDKMVGWLNGTSERTLNDLSEDIFNNFLIKSIHSEVKSEISFHKKRGTRLVILSSALRPVCQRVASHLGMDDIICSDLEVINGYLTGKTAGHLCFGEEKKVRLIKYCEINNTKQSDAWYYGDSIADLPALLAAGNPVCVNPDKKLKKEARKRGWKILVWQ